MATRRFYNILLTGMAFAGLAACCAQPVSMHDLKHKSQYWERANVSESTYMEGPKAQQMLQRDIARCVTELRELSRLGALRQAMPGNTDPYGHVPDPSTPEGSLAQWETPERDGALYAEHSDYHDFETCMQAKGWARVENVPYETAERARKTYVESIMKQQYRSNVGENKNPGAMPKSEWGNLNN